jgi:hypothetical protein
MLFMASSRPGHWVTVFTMYTEGRRPIPLATLQGGIHALWAMYDHPSQFSVLLLRVSPLYTSIGAQWPPPTKRKWLHRHRWRPAPQGHTIYTCSHMHGAFSVHYETTTGVDCCTQGIYFVFVCILIRTHTYSCARGLHYTYVYILMCMWSAL